MSQGPKEDVAYSRENELLTRYKEAISNDSLNEDEYKEAFEEIFKGYQRLLSDTKLLTSLGDRLQRKLRSTNMLLKQQSEEIREFNDNLNKKNVELKLTIDELTRARASRKARAFIFGFAFVLFVVSESLESVFDSFFPDSLLISIAFKSVLFLSLKPIEGILEKYFLNQSISKEKRDILKRVQDESFVESQISVADGQQ